MYVFISQVLAENWYSFFVYPILVITFFAISSKLIWALDFISPLIITVFVVTKTSHATFELGSIDK